MIIGMTREKVFRYFFIAVFLMLLYQVLHILSPFYTGILGAVVLALIFFPLHREMNHRVGMNRPNLAAALSTLSTTLLIAVPLALVAQILFQELGSFQPVVEKVAAKVELWRQGQISIDIPWLGSVEARVQSILRLAHTDMQKLIIGAASRFFALAMDMTRTLPRNVFAGVINTLVMIFTLYFLFRDGPAIFKTVKDLVPMDPKHKDHIADQLYATVTAVVRGLFMVALAQGSSAGIGFLIAGTPSPVLLGFATAVASLIPFVGAIAVWLPIAVYYLMQGSVGKGIFLFLWGAGVVSIVDNFLRPYLIGSRAKLPILFLFFALLGGIKVYGFMGLFLGPLVVALVIAFIKIYREEYHHELLKRSSAPPKPKTNGE